MHWLWWLIGIVLFLLFVVLAISLVCFFRVFYSPSRKKLADDEYEIPEGEIYEVFREDMKKWTFSIRAMPHEDVSITSFDGLTLRGRYFEYSKGAPMEILFHGYKGYGERDLSGGVERCFSLGRSALIVDHRASGNSDGHVITFGIKERRDCLAWVDFAVKRFGKEVRIGITGISMGGATVLMASAEPTLPENVYFVLADCPYSSAREIIMKVCTDMGLPPKLAYPFIRLGAIIYGGFDPDETSPMEAVKKSQLPTVFVHGDTDAFVPWEMSKRLYDACTSPLKKLITVKGAGHGLAYPVARESYVNDLREFDESIKR